MLIKRFIILIIFGCFSFSLCGIPCRALDISAECAVVMNADTYEVVYQKNPHKRSSMASTTKIMTSLIAVESGRLDDTVTVRTKALPEGTSIGAKYGYKYKFEDLVYGMLLESGNDAALIIAEHIGGNESNFATLMNRKADEIGMNNTNFVTSSGLDANEHYSTAYDMAMLGCYAVKNDKFREICSTKTKRINLVEPNISVTFSNHNRLLNSCDGVFGIKTGFTKKSGRCLVSSCERNGVSYVIATLNAPDDWDDHAKLYEHAFSNTKTFTYSYRGVQSIKVYGGNTDEITVDCDPFIISYMKKGDYKIRVILPRFVYAPIKKGDKLGEVRILLGGRIVYSNHIYSTHDVFQIDTNKKPRTSLLKKFSDFIKN